MDFYDGNVELENLHLSSDSPDVLIKGNLIVNDWIKQDYETSLIVLGDLVTNEIITSSQIFIMGNLTVNNHLYGNCTNYATSIFGNAQIDKLICVNEHWFCFYGKQNIDSVIDDDDTFNLENYEKCELKDIGWEEAEDFISEEDEVFNFIKEYKNEANDNRLSIEKNIREISKSDLGYNGLYILHKIEDSEYEENFMVMKFYNDNRVLYVSVSSDKGSKIEDLRRRCF